MREVWKAVPGYEKFYQVSTLGRVKSFHGRVSVERILNPTIDTNGYLVLRLSDTTTINKWYLHDIVTLTFLGPKPKNKEVRHLDGHKLNCKLSNFKYGSRAEQAADRIKHGTTLKGSKNPRAKLTEIKVEKIKKHLKRGVSVQRLAKKCKVTNEVIRKIKVGVYWAHVH